jgi:hypothetical protein
MQCTPQNACMNTLFDWQNIIANKRKKERSKERKKIAFYYNYNYSIVDYSNNETIV